MGSIARNTAIDSAAQAGVFVFSLIAGVVLARHLGDEGRGHYIYATTFAGQLLFSLTNIGMELSCSSIVGRDRGRLSEIHSLVLCYCVGLFFLTISVAWLFHETIRSVIFPELKLHGLLAIAMALPFWVYQSGAYGLLIGTGNVQTRSLFDLGFNFVQNLGVVLLVLFTAGGTQSRVVQLLTLTYFGLVMVGAFALWVLLTFKGARWKDPSIATAREFLRFGGWVWFGNLGSNISQRVDQHFVHREAGLGAFGVYTLAASLTQRTQIFPQALTRSVYARLGSVPTPEAARLTAQCFRQMLALGLVLLGIGAIVSPLIPLVYSAEFAGAVLPFIIFLVGRLFANCSWMLANFFTAHLARPKIPMLATWAVVPVQALGSWWAVQWGSLAGVTAVVAGCNLALLVVFTRLFLRTQTEVGFSSLVRLGAEDLAPWKAIIGRILGRRKA